MKKTFFFKFKYAENDDGWTARDEEERMQKIDHNLFVLYVAVFVLSAGVFLHAIGVIS